MINGKINYQQKLNPNLKKPRKKWKLNWKPEKGLTSLQTVRLPTGTVPGGLPLLQLCLGLEEQLGPLGLVVFLPDDGQPPVVARRPTQDGKQQDENEPADGVDQ